MRFFVAVSAILVFNYLLGMFLPWWIIVIVGCLSGYLIAQSPFKSMLSGILAGFLLWSAMAMYIDIANDQVLTKKIAGLFRLPQPWLMVVLTGLIGGAVTGMGALTGSLLRSLIPGVKT